MIQQTNRPREDQVKHYGKLLDEARKRHKNVEDQMTKIQYDCRLDIDSERVKQTSIKERLKYNNADIQKEQVLWDESKLKEVCYHARRDDYIGDLKNQLANCVKNEETLQAQIKNLIYKTPSKGEKHWIIAQGESQLGWIPHKDDYIPICTSKLPVDTDFKRLVEHCPYTKAFNLSLTIRNFIEHNDIVGWSSRNLVQALLLMLSKHRPDLYTKLNVKRTQHHQFFSALILNCSQPAEISQCRE